MNDRFKFRAWNSVRKIMITDKMESERFISFSGEVFVYSVGLECLGSNITLNPESVKLMQSTGLRDKNGVLIYEGDILKHKNDGMFIVKYHDSECGFVASYGVGDYSRLSLQIGERGGAVVIGNVYENPKLLNKVKI